MQKPEREFVLLRKRDQVVIRFADATDELPVRVAWARPIYGRGCELALLDEKKHEVLTLPGLDCLDAESRRVAEDELNKRYLVPKITRVIHTEAHFGNRYLHVETEQGARRFAMKDPARNAIWVTDDRLIVRDSLGNRFEVPSFSALDPASQAELMKII